MRHLNSFQHKTIAVAVLCVAGCLFLARGQGVDSAQSATPPDEVATASREMTLDECLTLAMKGNHRRGASRFAVVMAEAQHRQALAGYWPQISARAGYDRTDQAPDFIFPSTSIAVPAQAIHVPAGTALVTVPAGILGPTAVQLPVSTPAQTIGVAAQRLAVPADDIKLADPDSVVGSLDFTWLLFDGGMRKGYREQSGGLVDAMKAESRRTDLEIIDSVKRYYFGAVLARQLLQVGNDTLARMDATLNMTEGMYKNGSGKVKKTDYLDNKVVAETLRAMVAQLEKNEKLAQAALANTMGLSWHESIRPADKELPYAPYAGDLGKLVGAAYQYSPDWAKVEAGIRAAEGAVRTEQSGYYPKVAITGDLHGWLNSYNAGLATDNNKAGWVAGVGIDIPIFSGFLTRNKIAATRARVDQIKEQQILLKKGIGLEIKNVFLGLEAAQKSFQATTDAMTAARENRELNMRAYQDELVETEKVIKAQLVEALMSAQHYKTRYDHLALQSELDLLVGTEVLKKFSASP